MKKIKLITGLAALATLGTSVTVLASCSKQVVVEIDGGTYDKEKSHAELNKDSTIYLIAKKGKTITGVKKVMVGGVKLTTNQYKVEVDTEEETCKVSILASAMTSTNLFIEVDYGEGPVVTKTAKWSVDGDTLPNGVAGPAGVSTVSYPETSFDVTFTISTALTATYKGTLIVYDGAVKVGASDEFEWTPTTTSPDIRTVKNIDWSKINDGDSLIVKWEKTDVFGRKEFLDKYTEYYKNFNNNLGLMEPNSIVKITEAGIETTITHLETLWLNVSETQTPSYAKGILANGTINLGGANYSPDKLDKILPPKDSPLASYSYDNTTGNITFTILDEGTGEVNTELEFNKNALIVKKNKGSSESVYEYGSVIKYIDAPAVKLSSDAPKSTIFHEYNFAVDTNNKIKPSIQLYDSSAAPSITSITLDGSELSKNDYEVTSKDNYTTIKFKNYSTLTSSNTITINISSVYGIDEFIKDYKDCLANFEKVKTGALSPKYIVNATVDDTPKTISYLLTSSATIESEPITIITSSENALPVFQITGVPYLGGTPAETLKEIIKAKTTNPTFAKDTVNKTITCTETDSTTNATIFEIQFNEYGITTKCSNGTRSMSVQYDQQLQFVGSVPSITVTGDVSSVAKGHWINSNNEIMPNISFVTEQSITSTNVEVKLNQTVLAEGTDYNINPGKQTSITFANYLSTYTKDDTITITVTI